MNPCKLLCHLFRPFFQMMSSLVLSERGQVGKALMANVPIPLSEHRRNKISCKVSYAFLGGIWVYRRLMSRLRAERLVNSGNAFCRAGNIEIS